MVLDCWAADRGAPHEVLGLTCTLLRYAGVAAADGPPIMDDAAVVAAITRAYLPTDAPRWVAAAIESLGWSDELGGAASARLVEEVAAQVEAIAVVGLAAVVSDLV